MKLKSIQQSILTALLLSSSLFAFATNQQTLCPSVSLIKKSTSELNTVSFMGDKYAVWTLGYAFIDANLQWQVMSYPLAAPDFNTAFGIGQNNVKNVSGQIDKYAIETKDFYLCSYTTSQDNVLAISFKDESVKLKFPSFDLNLLNAKFS